ncbi:uncharacterized protein FFB20_14232 [Fusarium fujikuroi]|nr:uncharacterized protein FFC1_05639 [Fusarium fujikuroi]SCN93476.1 uncharacterized protein FFE2_07732 [Fusarium fujikuroi]SCO13314.1 uncharacterized protein FFB20_14232 [Fusarium fujikuroi]SCO22078.1 uncharacterized protein FFM5_12863 [Fusarium fujikuroi]SCO41903.1 uncharacterized protein FFNC_08211 [Fusarium fujikuroi]
MRFYTSFSLAVGLVAASPCKPPSSNQINLAVVSSVVTDISSTLIESASSTVDPTATTIETDVVETSTSAESSIAETSTTVGSTSTDYAQVSVSTTESLVEPTSTATTSEAATSIDSTTAFTTEASSVETSTAVETTTTSEEAVPTGYFLVAGEGPALGGKVKSNGDSFTPMIFGDRGSTFNPVRFLVDETTGELQQDGVTVCAYQQVGLPYALITRCETNSLYYGSVPLSCAQFEGPGTSISCSAVKLDCWQTGPGSSQACTRSPDADWDTFFITNSGDNVWYLSSGTLQNDFMTKVDVFVDHVEVSAPVQT